MTCRTWWAGRTLSYVGKFECETCGRTVTEVIRREHALRFRRKGVISAQDAQQLLLGAVPPSGRRQKTLGPAATLPAAEWRAEIRAFISNSRLTGKAISLQPR